jgi:hypothetical protein
MDQVTNPVNPTSPTAALPQTNPPTQTSPIKPKEKFSIKRVFIVSFISSLILCAAIAIIVFLMGEFGDLQFKILISTLIVTIFSLTGMCSSVLIDKGKYIPVAYSGLTISITTALLSFATVWGLPITEDLFKVTLSLVIVSISIAHASLLLLAHSDRNYLVNILVLLTNVFIVIVAAMLVLLIVDPDITEDDIFFRILGVFAVLDALGTIVTPIVSRFNVGLKGIE